MAKRVALITGGMGGLGETIYTKMADAGYQWRSRIRRRTRHPRSGSPT